MNRDLLEAVVSARLCHRLLTFQLTFFCPICITLQPTSKVVSLPKGSTKSPTTAVTLTPPTKQPSTISVGERDADIAMASSNANDTSGSSQVMEDLWKHNVFVTCFTVLSSLYFLAV